ncbi:hypothetical protein [Brevibacillus formosus]|uniref:hypothetical protein n=1 Tax=Brevibacillus formosus TaxID=54913 RepID=UPI003F19D501
MASIEKRGKNTWRLTVELGYGPDGERLRERETVKVEDPALLFKQLVESGQYIKPEKMTFAAFVADGKLNMPSITFSLKHLKII